MQFFFVAAIAFAAGFYAAQHIEVKIAYKATSQFSADLDGFDHSVVNYSTYNVE